MLTTLTGDVFLGYGRLMHCCHCNNRIQEHIVGSTMEGGFLGIPVAAMSSDFMTSAQCPICHKSTPPPSDPDFEKAYTEAAKSIDKQGHHRHFEELMLREKLLHTELLALGQDRTKQYHRSLGWTQRKIHLNRLRRFGFSWLAEFLAR